MSGWTVAIVGWTLLVLTVVNHHYAWESHEEWDSDQHATLERCSSYIVTWSDGPNGEPGNCEWRPKWRPVGNCGSERLLGSPP